MQAASAVASATMTPLNVEVPHNKLIELVAKVYIDCEDITCFTFIIWYLTIQSKNYGEKTEEKR